MSLVDLWSCRFGTDRLQVDPWHETETDLDLAEVVSGMLTTNTTAALPETWRGEFSVERATSWISERDAESPTLLAIEVASGRPVGLVIIFGEPLDRSSVDVRIGYLIAERAWGRGFATELLAGLVAWAHTQPSVHSLAGGVDVANPASARVLTKNGFDRIEDGVDDEDGETIYRLAIEHVDDAHG